MNIRQFNFTAANYSYTSKLKQNYPNLTDTSNSKLNTLNVKEDSFIKTNDGQEQNIQNIIDDFKAGNLTTSACKEKLEKCGATNIEEEGSGDMEGNSSTTIKFIYNNKEYSVTFTTKEDNSKQISSEEEWDNWSGIKEYHNRSELPQFSFIHHRN